MWDDLVAAALVGTERRGVRIPDRDGALGNLLSGLDPADGERTLLSMAAMSSLYERAGCIPQAAAPASPALCEAEIRQILGPRALQYLASILAHKSVDLLSEFLGAVDAAGKCVGPYGLPLLLDLAKDKPRLRELVTSTAGKRGLWLAALNPEWQQVAVSDEDVWESGGRDARKVYLRGIREVDPGHAREMLANAWDQEPPDNRAAFLETFDTGLGIDDEPFLEGALGDKRKEVRKIAAGLLGLLPGSGLRQRMLDRLTPLLGWQAARKSGFLGLVRSNAALEVVPPAECDKAMVRDGIVAKPPPGKGEKSWWLEQMLAVVPPGHWTQVLESTPEDLIGAALRGEWKQPLVDGWALAAAKHRDAAWSRALLSAKTDIATDRRADLLKVLPSRQAEEIVIAVLPSDRSLSALYECDFPWSPGFSLAVLGLFEQRSMRGIPQWHVAELCKLFATRMSPNIAPEVQRRLGQQNQDTPGWFNCIGDFVTALQFRHDMLKAVAEE
jgi:hypothetical protein